MFHRFSFSKKYKLNISVSEQAQAVLMKIKFYDFLKYLSFSIHKIWKVTIGPKVGAFKFWIHAFISSKLFKNLSIAYIVVSYTDSHLPENTKSKFQIQK